MTYVLCIFKSTWKCNLQGNDCWCQDKEGYKCQSCCVPGFKHFIVEVVLKGLAEFRLFCFFLQLRLCFGAGAAATLLVGHLRLVPLLVFFNVMVCRRMGRHFHPCIVDTKNLMSNWTSDRTGVGTNMLVIYLAGSSRTCSAWCPRSASGSRRCSGWCFRWDRRAASTSEWSARRSWTRKWGPVALRVLLHIRNRAASAFGSQMTSFHESFHSHHATGLMDWEQTLVYIYSEILYLL